MQSKRGRRGELHFYALYLSDLFGGVRAQVDEKPLLKLHKEQNLKGMFALIQKSFGVKNVEVHLREPKPGTIQGWLEIPKGSVFGEPFTKKRPGKVFVKRSLFQGEDFYGVVITIAHELSHALMFLKGNPLFPCEEATELAAMILGYRRIYLRAYTPRRASLAEVMHPQRLLSSPLKYLENSMDFLLGARAMKTRRGCMTYKEVRFAVRVISSLK